MRFRDVIGQEEAKKAVAIALRNRYRRSKLPANLKEEITPKNIILKTNGEVVKIENKTISKKIYVKTNVSSYRGLES